MELATKEIEKSSGLSRETLRTYVRLGWLELPEYRSHGRYGASLYWPAATVERLLTIKALKKTGHKNKAIDEVLKGAI